MSPVNAIDVVAQKPSIASNARRAGKPLRRLLRWFLILDLCIVLAAAGAYHYVTGSPERLDGTLKWTSEQVFGAVSGVIDSGYDPQTARTIAETAEPILLRLVSLGGNTPVMAHRRGWINLQLARCHDVIGNPVRQMSFAEAAKRAFERAAALEPDNRDWHRDLAAVENDLGNALAAIGDLDGALRHYREGRRRVLALMKDDPENAKLKGDLGASLGKLGRHYVERGWRRQGTSYL
jgi:tetratricopeptide (TPR) repeat protein